MTNDEPCSCGCDAAGDLDGSACRSIKRVADQGQWPEPVDDCAPVPDHIARRAAARMAGAESVAGFAISYPKSVQAVRKAWLDAAPDNAERAARMKAMHERDARHAAENAVWDSGCWELRDAKTGTLLKAGPLSPTRIKATLRYERRTQELVRELADPALAAFKAEMTARNAADRARAKAETEAQANFDAIQREANDRVLQSRQAGDTPGVVTGTLRILPTAADRETEAREKGLRDAARERKAEMDRRVEKVRADYEANGKVPSIGGLPQRRP